VDSCLAMLAGWQPRPGDGPPYRGKRGTAQAWVRFWKERYRTPGSELDGLIAAAARLHLAEAGWLPSGPSPERLREEFHQWMQQWSVSTYQDLQVLRILLSFVPADASAPEQQQQNIMKWLELTRRNVPREKREAAWGMLAAWQREGILERSSRGRLPEPPRLLPDLARTLEWEQDREVLQAMVGYVPGAAEVRAHPKAVRDIVARWEALGRNDDWRIRQAAWVGRWNLMRAGVLTAEEQGRFGADYVEAMKFEPEVTALLTLAQITPPGMFPLATWAGRLSDQNRQCRLAAQLAIHDWLVEVMERASGEWKFTTRYSLLAARYSLLATHDSPLVAGRCGRSCAGPGRKLPEQSPRSSISRRRCGLTSGGCTRLKPPSPPVRCRRRMPVWRTGRRRVLSWPGCRKPTRGRTRPALPKGRPAG